MLKKLRPAFMASLGLVVVACWAWADAAGGAFQAPQTVPAAMSALAARVPVNALSAAGPRLVTAGQRGYILYADDARTWRQAAVPVSSDLTGLSFPSANQGWAVGHQGVILHSSDGGATWTKQLDGQEIANLLVKKYSQPTSPSDPVAQRLAKQVDLFAAQGVDKPLLDVWFEDERKGFAIGAFNLILRTEDGGKQWTPWMERTDNPDDSHLYAIRPVGDALFIVGERGLVLKLDRERQRFVSVPLPYKGTLFGVTGNARTVLVYGLRGNAWRSTDGGANWSKVDTGVNAGLSGGITRADGSMVLASQAGQLLASSDEGASFSRVKTEKIMPIFAVAGIKDDQVALAGIGGVRIETVK